MKYVIVYLLRGEVEKYHKSLVSVVGPKFGEIYMIRKKTPSHVTLHSPFHFEDLKELEKTIKLFSSKNKSSALNIGGFDNFRRFVAFLKTKFSNKGIKVQKDLVKVLKSLGIETHEFDKKWEPHATLTYGNSKESFDNIWKYLKGLDKSNFKVKFDNIAILKKSRNRWKVHKIYDLKD